MYTLSPPLQHFKSFYFHVTLGKFRFSFCKYFNKKYPRVEWCVCRWKISQTKMQWRRMAFHIPPISRAFSPNRGSLWWFFLLYSKAKRNMNFNGNYLHILALCCWKNCIERKFNIKKYFIDILRGQKKFLVRRARRSSIKKGDDIEVAVSELKIFCQNSPQIGNIFIKLPKLFFFFAKSSQY